MELTEDNYGVIAIDKGLRFKKFRCLKRVGDAHFQWSRDEICALSKSHSLKNSGSLWTIKSGEQIVDLQNFRIEDDDFVITIEDQTIDGMGNVSLTRTPKEDNRNLYNRCSGFIYNNQNNEATPLIRELLDLASNIDIARIDILHELESIKDKIGNVINKNRKMEFPMHISGEC